jgi:DNA-binding GntR family transcriptional regulator
VRQTLGEQVASQLRKELTSGTLSDESLQQEALCERFGTSRTPVRDALRQLVHEGFLEWTPNNKVHHVNFDEHDIEDIFDMEVSLTGRLAMRASQRASEPDIEHLWVLHQEMLAETRRANFRALDELNEHFHETINRLALAPKLLAALSAVTIKVHRGYLYESKADASRLNEEHAELLQAIQARDPPQAEMAMRRHVESSSERVIPRVRAALLAGSNRKLDPGKIQS